MANDLSGGNSSSIGRQQSCDFSRRQLFRNATAIAGGVAVLAAAMAPQRAEASQMTQQAAGYKASPKGDQRCDGCSLFQAPSSCKLVAGDISPSGWCRLYVKKKS
jgi:hypothetical protein